jgi:hypothetical protein
MGSISYPSSYGVTGLGSDFAVYNYALTPEQVALHYLASQNISTLDYKTIVLNTKPIAYWPCDDAAGSTTITDASGNGNNMTVNTADSYVSLGNTPLRYGSNGSIQSLDLSWAAYTANSFNINTNSYGYSVELIIAINSSNPGNTIFGPNGTSSTAGSPGIFVGQCTTSTTTITLNSQMPGGGTYTFDYVAYEPIHIVYCSDGSSTYLYVDSVLIASSSTVSTSTSAFTSSGMCLLGSQNYSSSYGLIGKASDFAIYNRTLTQADVTAHYKATLVPAGTAWRYWRIYIYQNNGDPTYTVIGLGMGPSYVGPSMIWADQIGGNTIATTSMVYNQSSMYNSGDTFIQPCLGSIDSGNGVWISNTPINSWGSVDFLSPVSINEVRIYCQPNGTTGVQRAPKDFAIQVSSDNINWQNMKKFRNVTQWTPGNFLTFPLVDSL